MIMLEFKSTIQDVSIDFATGNPKITLVVEQNRAFADKLNNLTGKDLNIKMSRYKERRSKSANAYMWELIGKLRDELQKTDGKIDKEEIYQSYIKHYGKSVDYELPNDAVKAMTSVWTAFGLGWFTEKVDEGDEKSIIRFYYGSSSYGKKRMSRLIDAVIQDCKQLGIETMTPDEIAEMKARWRE